MNNLPAPIAREKARMYMIAGALLMASVFMVAWTRQIQTAIIGILLVGGYVFFIYRHFHAASKGYDVFEGECVGRAYNPVTHLVMYSFAGRSKIRLAGRKLPILKGQWVRLYLPKGSVSKAESKSQTLQEFYGYEEIMPPKGEKGNPTFDPEEDFGEIGR